MQWQNRPKYYPKYILKPPGRRIAVGDIHGSYHTLLGLMNQVQLDKQDQIFFLGDYIHRGSQSASVLDFLIELGKTHPGIFTLRGNHEQKFLLAYAQGMRFLEDFLDEYNGLDLLNDKLYDYLEFCDNLDYCVISEKQFLSHCGISRGLMTPLNDLRMMFSQVEIIIQDEIPESFDIIYGHIVEPIIEIEKKVSNKIKHLSLDAGCVYKDNPELGFLCALDLDSFELYKQKNID